MTTPNDGLKIVKVEAFPTSFPVKEGVTLGIGRAVTLVSGSPCNSQLQKARNSGGAGDRRIGPLQQPGHDHLRGRPFGTQLEETAAGSGCPAVAANHSAQHREQLARALETDVDGGEHIEAVTTVQLARGEVPGGQRT